VSRAIGDRDFKGFTKRRCVLSLLSTTSSAFGALSVQSCDVLHSGTYCTRIS
jgi:hypothetical protein